MPSTPPPSPAEPPEYFEDPRQPAAGPQRGKLSRKASLIGTTVAVLVAFGLVWLAWDLTRPEPTTVGQRGAGGPGGPGGVRGPGGPGPRGGTTVGVAAAATADIPVTLQALGTVVPQATVRVRPQVSGVLQQVLFQEGQNVRKGQLLAVIDPRSFEAALQQAVGQRMRDEAQLAAARVTLQRFEKLLELDSIARQEVDTQRATVRQLEAAVVSAKAAEQAARLNLSHTRIVAPIEGRLGLREVDVGNTVGPGDANGIVTITKLKPIDVAFAVPQDHAAWLQHNAGASMDVAAYDRTRTTLLDKGVFASLDNQVDTQTGTVRAKARFDNARQQLFPNQFVNVSLEIRTIEDAVVVPVTAVRQGGQGDHVFVVMDDRTVQLRPVVRGELLDDRVQIVSGLRVGERVVTEGADRLRHGSRVVLPGEAPRGPGAGGPGGRPGGPGGAPAAPGPQSPASAPLAGPEAAADPAPVPAAMGAGRQARPAQAEVGQGREALSPEERAARRAQRSQAAQPAPAR